MSKQTWTCRSPEGARPNDRSGAGLTEVLITIAIVAIVVAVYLAVFRTRVRENDYRPQCKNNLKQIGLALHNYHEEHGSFPPAYTTDVDGTPLHSWRTLILPYLDQKPLYETIDLSKPWNDPANAKAYASHMSWHACPETEVPDSHTTYMALVGPGCAFQSGPPRKFRDIQDATSKTIQVVEVAAADSVHWMDPRDSANRFFLNPNATTVLSHTGGFYVLLCDGTIRFLPKTLPKETRKALSTIAGREEVGEF